jgi:hypothetical protein
MATTFTKIASVSVGVLGASSIDFTSIPSTYTDVVMKISARTDLVGTGEPIYMAFNGNTSNNSYRQLQGTGSGTGSYSGSGSAGNTAIADASSATSTANTFGNSEIYIPNYAGSNSKCASGDAVSENNATAARADLYVLLNSGTSAVNQLTIYPSNTGGKFVQYSTATLYGINKS